MSFKCTKKEAALIKAYRKLTTDAKSVIDNVMEYDASHPHREKKNQNVCVLSLVNENINITDREKESWGSIGVNQKSDLISNGRSDIEIEFNEQFYIAESCSGLLFHIMCNGDLKYINESVLHSTAYSTQAAVTNMEIAFGKLLDLYGDALKATG